MVPWLGLNRPTSSEIGSDRSDCGSNAEADGNKGANDSGEDCGKLGTGCGGHIKFLFVHTYFRAIPVCRLHSRDRAILYKQLIYMIYTNF